MTYPQILKSGINDTWGEKRERETIEEETTCLAQSEHVLNVTENANQAKENTFSVKKEKN